MKRDRRRARGSIIEKERGKRYEIQVSLPVDPTTGRNRRKSLTVRGSYTQAEKALDDLKRQLDTGTLASPAKLTVGEYLERWLRDYAGMHLSPRTVEGYRTIIKNHLIPELGHYPLQKLTGPRIAEYYRDRQQTGRRDGEGGLSSTTVRQHAMVLHKAFETAIEWGTLARNPADKVKIPKPGEREKRYYDPAWAERILEASRDHPLYPVFYLAIGSGMRRSELMGLRWCDIVLSEPAVFVTRTLHQLHTGEYVIRPPKTKESNRRIPLSAEVAQVLRKYRVQRETEAVMQGTQIDENALVFAEADGSHIRPDLVSSVWRKYARKCGLEDFRFHDARHFYVSMLIKLGVHVKLISTWLGHSSVKTTMDIYGHLLPTDDTAIQGFDALVFNKEQGHDGDRRK